MRRVVWLMSVMAAPWCLATPPLANPPVPLEISGEPVGPQPLAAAGEQPVVAEPSATPGVSHDAATPAAPRVAPPSESLPLGVPAASPSVPEPTAAPPSVLSSPAVRTISALTLVLSLIFGLRSVIRAGGRRAGGVASALGAAGRAPSGVLSVLGRYPVGKGATLVLLQLDRRVLLLSQTGAGFTTLCELTDADDVASVVRKTADDEGASLAKRFSSMLRASERDPTIVGENPYESPLSPRRAMALRDYEAAIGAGPAQNPVQAPGRVPPADTSIRRRLDRLRGTGS